MVRGNACARPEPKITLDNVVSNSNIKRLILVLFCLIRAQTEVIELQIINCQLSFATGKCSFKLRDATVNQRLMTGYQNRRVPAFPVEVK